MRPSIEFLKRQAKKLVKSSGVSHSEALDAAAKSYGFGNWSQLMNALPQGLQVEPQISGALTSIKTVLSAEPHLSAFGFGVFDGRRKSSTQIAIELAKARENTLTEDNASQFERCCRWLSMVKRRASINSNVGSSYGLKHQVENYWAKHFPDEDRYIANGMFIIAAIHLGFKFKRIDDGPNAYFNISSKAPPS